MEGIEASPGNNDLVIQVIFLLGFGFSFLLSIFPFHSWKPMVAEVTHPYVMAFLFNLIPGFLFFLLLTFFNHYSWLRNSESLMTALMIIGGINVLIGGYRILFENNLGRVMGYLSVMEIGLILSAISIGGKECLSLAIGLMVGFNVSTFLFAITSSILFTHLGKVPKYEQLLGLGTKLPGISVLLILSLLGAIGFPLLSSFPVIFSLITRIGEQSLFVALMIFFGILGALSGGFRLIYTLFIQPEKSEKTIDNSEVYNSPKWLLIFISGYIILFLSGNFPQYYFGLFENLINFFDQF
ncbi:MAG: hypothetical protein JXA19_06425 [Anaerolineales bacterium]|nr:hypothetical protein [Anaerolineales bacterium]